MLTRTVRFSVVVPAIVIAICLCLETAGAQTRRKRSSRRASKPVITNPTIADPNPTASPSPAEDRIISTANEDPAEPEQEKGVVETKSRKTKSAAKPVSDEKEIQETINALSNQVERLSDKLTQMQEHDKALLDLERLTRAEQRAEALRTQLFEVEGKIADLETRSEQLDYALKPENIERATAAFGSLRPEDARDSRMRQLQSEKSRVKAQLRILEQSRVRLEASINSADTEVDLLRRRIEMQRQREDSAVPENESKPTTTRKKPPEKP